MFVQALLVHFLFVTHLLGMTFHFVGNAQFVQLFRPRNEKTDLSYNI